MITESSSEKSGHSLFITAGTEIYNYSIAIPSDVNALAFRPGSCLISESFSRLYDSKSLLAQ